MGSFSCIVYIFSLVIAIFGSKRFENCNFYRKTQIYRKIR
ncbi:hypothetical protein PALI_b0416 [Pseudoalteromonas aliena SW19]|uniref:Uncharacterized protein n=1 Tax=Pseudoalteromonas aliena SW19 TaxID=1314866 RepID=A0ABR9E494_9GAMM|nr:hypothetical protein [Pseudoalteromonas aliena SW19]